MRRVLRAERPQDAIDGEEGGQEGARDALRWLLDPVDGTRAFVCGAPTWGILIALADARGPVLGLIDQPHIGERFWGRPGEAWMTHAGRAASPLATCATAQLDDARLMTTFPEVGTSAERAAFERLAGRVRLTRYGLDCYAYALLAAGQVDLVVEAGLQPHDIAAPIAVIEAAGGIVTDWSGGPAHGGGRVLAAANRPIHAAALKLLDAGE